MKGAALEAARAHCPVCCGDLEAQVVFCARCATPHHDECWQFTGRCAIYACTCEQFTHTEAGGGDDLLLVDEDVADVEPRRPPSPSGGRRTLPAVAPVSLPARRPSENPDVAHLAQSKRAAFRHWIRELLDEGLRVPRLWMGAPIVHKRMRMPQQEHEATTQFDTRVLVWVLLGILPLIMLLVLAGEPSWWVAFELAGYLGLIGILHMLTIPFHRELIVDSQQNLMIEMVDGPINPPRQRVCNLRQAAAVALAVDGDVSSGLHAGVVLLDFERRPIQIPGMLLPAGRSAVDEDVRKARATARFLGLTFAGAVDGKGRRRRLPEPDGTAPGS